MMSRRSALISAARTLKKTSRKTISTSISTSRRYQPSLRILRSRTSSTAISPTSNSITTLGCSNMSTCQLLKLSSKVKLALNSSGMEEDPEQLTMKLMGELLLKRASSMNPNYVSSTRTFWRRCSTSGVPHILSSISSSLFWRWPSSSLASSS